MNTRELIDAYTRTKPMNRAAHELADTLRAVLDVTAKWPKVPEPDEPRLFSVDSALAISRKHIEQAITTALETTPLLTGQRPEGITDAAE